MSAKKIVCYIDLDSNSRKGVLLCGAIAENLDASVEVVLTDAKIPFYSTSIGGEPIFTPPSVSLALFEKSRKAIDKKIDEVIATLELTNEGGDVSEHRLDEHQIDALIEHAVTVGADLIVMSSEPAGFFDRMFHRSFAERLARQSVCPVLVIAGDTEVVPPIRRVLIAVDYSEESRRAAFVAREMLDAKGVMYFQHVWEEDAIADAKNDMPPGADSKVAFASAREAQVAKLEDFVRALNFTDIEARCHLSSGVPHESIDEYAIEMKCDVIVVGSHPHDDWSEKLFGTVTDRLIENSKKPVLAVPKTFAISQPLSSDP